MRKRQGGKLRGELATFVRKYARRAQRGVEPNDRRYDRKMEKLMNQLSPKELSALLNDDADNKS